MKTIMKTIFREVLGESPQVRVLDFLIENKRTSWSLVEIYKNTHISYEKLRHLLPKLSKQRLIKIDKQVGKSKFYQVNESDPYMKGLMMFYADLIKIIIEIENAKQKDKIRV